MLEVVDEQAEMLRMCGSMIRSIFHVIRTSFELREEMEKDVLLDLNPG